MKYDDVTNQIEHRAPYTIIQLFKGSVHVDYFELEEDMNQAVEDIVVSFGEIGRKDNIIYYGGVKSWKA